MTDDIKVMYDNYEINCPVCGKTITINLSEVHNIKENDYNKKYTICHYCGIVFKTARWHNIIILPNIYNTNRDKILSNLVSNKPIEERKLLNFLLLNGDDVFALYDLQEYYRQNNNISTANKIANQLLDIYNNRDEVKGILLKENVEETELRRVAFQLYRIVSLYSTLKYNDKAISIIKKFDNYNFQPFEHHYKTLFEEIKSRTS